MLTRFPPSAISSSRVNVRSVIPPHPSRDSISSSLFLVSAATPESLIRRQFVRSRSTRREQSSARKVNPQSVTSSQPSRERETRELPAEPASAATLRSVILRQLLRSTRDRMWRRGAERRRERSPASVIPSRPLSVIRRSSGTAAASRT